MVATVLEVDNRLGAGRRPVTLELADAALLTLACDIIDAIDIPPARVELPSGTTLETQNTGEIQIGGEEWVFIAGQPGLYPSAMAPRGATGPNLDLLHKYILRKTRKLACRRLGLPKPVFVCDTDARHLLHFDPLSEAGGVVLQLWSHVTGAPLFCAALPWQIETFADEIVKDMRRYGGVARTLPARSPRSGRSQRRGLKAMMPKSKQLSSISAFSRATTLSSICMCTIPALT